MYWRDNLRNTYLEYCKTLILILSEVQVTVFNLHSTADILCMKIDVDTNNITFANNVSTWSNIK